jgi:hypothetical protein
MTDHPDIVVSAPDQVGAELEPVTHGTLFRTEDPVEIIRRASDTADVLAGVLRKQKLITNIQGKEHVRVEGWTLLGTMLGVFPVCEWTRPLEGGSGWEARVVARTLAGQEVGAAEAQCSRSENTWKNRDDYALRSMAQTRATSKALRQPLGFVVSLAGFEATPAEEMDFTSAPVEKQERRVEGPAPLKAPTSWAKLTEMVSAYDEATHDLFFAFADSARRYLFPESESTAKMGKQDKDVLFQKCSTVALTLRDRWDPNEMPYPDANHIRAVFASVLDGVELAIPGEEE